MVNNILKRVKRLFTYIWTLLLNICGLKYRWLSTKDVESMTIRQFDATTEVGKVVFTDLVQSFPNIDEKVIAHVVEQLGCFGANIWLRARIGTEERCDDLTEEQRSDLNEAMSMSWDLFLGTY